MLKDLLSFDSKLLVVFFTVTIFAFCSSRWKKWLMIYKLPGPPFIPIIGNYPSALLNRVDPIQSLMESVKTASGLKRLYIGPYAVVILTAPEYLKVFFTNAKMIERSEHYNFGREAFGDSLFIVGGSRWKELRKLAMTNFFNSTPLDVLKTTFVNISKNLIVEFKKRADGPLFPCSSLLQQATADSILVNICGEEIPQEEKEPLVMTVEGILRTLFLRIFSAIHHFNFTFDRTRTGRTFRKQVSHYDKFARTIIEKKNEELKRMTERGENTPNLYIYKMLEKFGDDSIDFISGELKTQIVAGQDTTAGTMSAVLTILGIFPEIQEKIYQEDQEVQRQLAGRELEVEDLQSYPYLERVIKESLRLFPLAPLVGRRLTEDTYFGEYLVPKGTDVAALLISTNHDPKLFPDPYKFDPDRFLPENVKNIPPYAYNPFGAGPRMCPGMRYANMAMKIFLSSVVRNFRVYSKYSTVQEVLDLVDASFILKSKENYPIRLETRRKECTKGTGKPF